MAFTDDYSGLCSLYFTRSKDAVPSALDEYLTTFVTPRKTWVGPTTLQSDSEPVYMGGMSQMRATCLKHGVLMQASTPHAPQQNGVAERLWRTLLTTSNAMRNDAGLDTTYWQYAMGAAAYIHNRLPSRSNEGYVSPFFVLTGKHPSIAHLRVFGCPATVTIQPKQGKEVLPGKNGIFVGYDLDTPSYMVYTPDNGRVHMSMQVKFHESHVMSGRARAQASRLEQARIKLLDAAHGITCQPSNPCDTRNGPGTYLQKITAEKRAGERLTRLNGDGSEPQKKKPKDQLWTTETDLDQDTWKDHG